MTCTMQCPHQWIGCRYHALNIYLWSLIDTLVLMIRKTELNLSEKAYQSQFICYSHNNDRLEIFRMQFHVFEGLTTMCLTHDNLNKKNNIIGWFYQLKCTGIQQINQMPHIINHKCISIMYWGQGLHQHFQPRNILTSRSIENTVF